MLNLEYHSLRDEVGRDDEAGHDTDQNQDGDSDLYSHLFIVSMHGESLYLIYGKIKIDSRLN